MKKERPVLELTVRLDTQTVRALKKLRNRGAAGPTVESVLEYLAESAAEGVERPGSWENDWITSAFGAESLH